MSNEEIARRSERHVTHCAKGVALLVLVALAWAASIDGPTVGVVFLGSLIVGPIVVGCLAGDRPWGVSIEDWERYERGDER
jgi:hypothetical protein